MSADPSLVAKYTQDGVTLTYQNDALKAAQPNALDGGEIETWFRYESDVQAQLDERASLQSTVGGVHEAVEVTEQLGVGTAIPVVPNVPCWTVVDTKRDLNQLVRTVGTSFDMTIDRYSLELLQ